MISNCFTRAHSQRFMTCRSVCRISVFKIPPFHIVLRESHIFQNHKCNLATLPRVCRASGHLEHRSWTAPVLDCPRGSLLPGHSSCHPQFVARTTRSQSSWGRMNDIAIQRNISSKTLETFWEGYKGRLCSRHDASLYYHTVNLSHHSLLLHQPPDFLASVFGWVGLAATPGHILTNPTRISHNFTALPRYYRQGLCKVLVQGNAHILGF